MPTGCERRPPPTGGAGQVHRRGDPVASYNGKLQQQDDAAAWFGAQRLLAHLLAGGDPGCLTLPGFVEFHLAHDIENLLEVHVSHSLTIAEWAAYLREHRAEHYAAGYALPAETTDARPGRAEKMAVLAERVERGEALHHPKDRRHDERAAWLKDRQQVTEDSVGDLVAGGRLECAPWRASAVTLDGGAAVG